MTKVNAVKACCKGFQTFVLCANLEVYKVGQKQAAEMLIYSQSS